ncbi:MAG: type I-U CRISPR-associated protein Cas8c [Chloroflexi bacterium]|nr:type I-U CRISPR-associated protein Cas8c [Chloroflexota bacterium]
MAEACIPVDLFNPGQVFACLGFLEAADVLLGDAEGGFDWSDEADVRFLLRAGGDKNPFAVVLGFLSGAAVLSLVPFRSGNDTGRWQVPTEVLTQDEPFPFPDPPSPATLPAVLQGARANEEAGPVRLVIDHWGDRTSRDAVKFWGGAAGYPGAALARDAIELVRDRCLGAEFDPFGLSAEQTSSFRFDWRRDYVPVEIGFSLNEHAWMAPMGFPLVEVFAALGLANARPLRVHALEYRYAVIGIPRETARVSRDEALFHPSLLRAALGGSPLPFPQRVFRMTLGWPATEGQARAITTVREEQAR